MPLPAAPQEV
ncbi:hypothetical protein BME75_20345 [Klebsiella pneumoniae]|nr:hypothetical protein BME21_25120 [Klebsiella pneumoniae]OVY08434.1 hypothetical protein BME75_20345 [Klebsiella pneumoniae]OVY11710.1 hypothetical protein BME72_20050 [Klebsiella pneumoniae]